jgi:hypothetical protein
MRLSVESKAIPRVVDALENIAAELEALRTLEEYKLGVEVVYSPEGDPPVVRQRFRGPEPTRGGEAEENE